MKTLGIDFGLKKIGVAVGFEDLIEPRGTFREPTRFVEEIARLCQEEEIEKIVIGVTEGLIANKAAEFVAKLKKQMNIPVDFQDETLTTKEAVARMVAIGRGKKARRQEEDAYAAACILEEYLARRRANV